MAIRQTLTKGDKLSSPRKFAFYAAIVIPPRTEFPIDMLRYDCAYPSCEIDSAMIQQTFGYNESETTIVFIETERSDARGVVWNFDRWQSFSTLCMPLEADEYHRAKRELHEPNELHVRQAIAETLIKQWQIRFDIITRKVGSR